jgi:arginase family enzyme
MIFPFTVYKHAGGISLAALTKIITDLHASSNIVGLSIVEYNDESGLGAQKLAGLLRLCAEIVSKE